MRLDCGFICLNYFVLVLNEDTRIIKTVLMDILVGLYCAFTKQFISNL